MSPTRAPATTSFGYVAGTILVSGGVLGFAVTGFGGFAATGGDRLLGLELNPLHNLLHVTTGLALVIGASHGGATARTLALVTAAAFGVIGTLGLALVGTEGNVLALNHADNVLHLVLAAIAGVAYALDVRGRQRMGREVGAR